MRTSLKITSLLLFAMLLSVPVHAQDPKTPFAPVTEPQRKALAARLNDFTHAYRARDWDALYGLVSDVNLTIQDGTRLTKPQFAYWMAGGFDAQRLLRFTPFRIENFFAHQFDVYGCGEFPSGLSKPQRFVVAVRVVREHDNWFLVAWDYADPHEDCSALSAPAWQLPQNLNLQYLPELTCAIHLCTL